VVRRRCRNHVVAGAARQFLANVPDDLEPAWHVIEGLGHLVTDLTQRVADPLGEVSRQRAPCRLLRLGRDLSTAAATAGDAIVSRFAWSISAITRLLGIGSTARPATNQSRASLGLSKFSHTGRQGTHFPVRLFWIVAR
jgi:hypothetical protein